MKPALRGKRGDRSLMRLKRKKRIWSNREAAQLQIGRDPTLDVCVPSTRPTLLQFLPTSRIHD
jgi:hypothetical protein